jgi:hypothetical protein
MEEPSVAELLPELYREVLDRVAALEVHGQRTEAGRVRADATEAYSRAWDNATLRKLRALRVHAERVIAGRERPHTRHPLAAAIARFTPERGV